MGGRQASVRGASVGKRITMVGRRVRRVDIPWVARQNEKLLFSASCAQVAELADALASGASGRKVVEVRVLSWAPSIYNPMNSRLLRGCDPLGSDS